MRRSLNVLSALAFLAPFSLAQAQPTLTTLYNFTGGQDGAAPYATPFVSQSGALYGTASGGGSPADGTAYELTNASGTWTQTVIHNFTGYPNDGQTPYANLISSKNGTLYGTTYIGGGNGDGTVFRIVPPSTAGGAWTENVLYGFLGSTGGSDGANPHGGLIMGAHGLLYGTTAGGGTNGNGTVFQLTPPTATKKKWVETVLYRFTGTNGDGAFPEAGLVMGKNGALYGTTAGGGSGCTCGVVFELTPSTSGAWTETILYAFEGASDGAFPESGLIFDSHGALYGTTYQGGPAGLGTAFRLAPPTTGTTWTKRTLHSFGGSDGAYPFAALVLDSNGTLYGTTVSGGTYGYGTVFELANVSGTWTESILYNFSGGSDGGAPFAGLVFSNGVLLGATSAGGTADKGTVFQLTL